MNGPVHGVLVDLDDTLYPQAEFLDLAWRAVARAGAGLGLDEDALLVALLAEAAPGSARGGIIDRALAHVGGAAGDVGVLLAAFRDVTPPRLAPYPDAVRALAELRRRVPIALVTDGEVAGQQRKVSALGLDGAFDVVVFSDLGGRTRRKPHPHPFRTALDGLDISGEHAVMIGDRPDKDVVGAVAAGMRAIRVGTGEYAGCPDHPATWLRADTFAGAVAAVLPHLVAR